MNTLRDGAEAEGAAVLSFLERQGQPVFEQHGFGAVGEPSAGCQAVSQAQAYQPQVREARRVTSALATVCQDLRPRGLAAGYESAADTVTIHLDDEGVKERKAQRSDPVTEPAATLSDPPARTASKRPTVQNTVARIEHAGRGFPFSGRRLHPVLGFVRVSLLSNGLVARRWVCFTDGHRALQTHHRRFFRLAWRSVVARGWVPCGEEVSRRAKLGLHGT